MEYIKSIDGYRGKMTVNILKMIEEDMTANADI